MSVAGHRDLAQGFSQACISSTGPQSFQQGFSPLLPMMDWAAGVIIEGALLCALKSLKASWPAPTPNLLLSPPQLCQPKTLLSVPRRQNFPCLEPTALEFCKKKKKKASSQSDEESLPGGLVFKLVLKHCEVMRLWFSDMREKHLTGGKSVWLEDSNNAVDDGRRPHGAQAEGCPTADHRSTICPLVLLNSPCKPD